MTKDDFDELVEHVYRICQDAGLRSDRSKISHDLALRFARRHGLDPHDVEARFGLA